MRGNFGLFRTFSPKLPRIHVDDIVMQMRKINREKGYYLRHRCKIPIESSSLHIANFEGGKGVRIQNLYHMCADSSKMFSIWSNIYGGMQKGIYIFLVLKRVIRLEGR